MFKLGAIVVSKEELDQFITSIFTVPNPDGTRRFVLNLKSLSNILKLITLKWKTYEWLCT